MEEAWPQVLQSLLDMWRTANVFLRFPTFWPGKENKGTAGQWNDTERQQRTIPGSILNSGQFLCPKLIYLAADPHSKR